MLHAAIARPQKVVALIGIATAVDGLVIQFNQLPVEVGHKQPQCTPPVIAVLLLSLDVCSCVICPLTSCAGSSFALAAFLYIISLPYLTDWALVQGLLFFIQSLQVILPHISATLMKSHV